MSIRNLQYGPRKRGSYKIFIKNLLKKKEKKRARGSNSTAEEDVSDEMILEKLPKIHEDIKTVKEELKG